MVTTASKLYFGAATVAFVAAAVYGWGTGGGFLGVLTAGLMGGVGELAGYTILAGTGVILTVLGIASSILRDADPEAAAAAARLESLPAIAAPSAQSYWPILGGASIVAAAVGLVASPVVFVIGLIGAGLVGIEWMVLAWSERATGDPAINQQIRNRLMYPVEIPVGGALAILVLVVAVSRILLALSKDASSGVAIAVALFVLALGFLISYRPKLSKDAVAGIVAVSVLVVIGAGIVAAATGSREFHPHEEDDTELAPEGEEGGG
jgi:hypothetical protein